MPVYAALHGASSNDGSEFAPWPLQYAIDHLDGTDDHVLVLLPGVYDGPIRISGLTRPDPPYVISGASPATVVIDGSVPEFRTVPNDRWQHVGDSDSDEYVATMPHPTTDPARGSFLSRRPYTRLITHQFLKDLQSANERAGPICPDNPLDGPPPRQPEPPAHPDVARRRPWTYLGPGLFHDPAAVDKKIHVRLSPTHHHLAGFPDYDGETDPRKVPLAIWFAQRATVRITGCFSVTFSNVTVRHGDTAITIEDCDDVSIDHVAAYAGSDGIKLRGTCNRISLTNVLVDGGLPPWYFRSDRKDEFHLASDATYEDAQAPGQNTMKALLSGTATCFDSMVRNCEFVNGHDLSTFGTGSRFSRNWIQNLDDDAVIIDTEGSADLQIFENVIEQCQTVFSSGDAAGFGTSVYRNLIDLRRPFAKSRPTVYEERSCYPMEDRRTLGVGVLVKTNPPDGPLNFFHNTCLVRDNEVDASFNHFSGWGDSRRNVFNNIFVAVNSVQSSDKPICFLPNVDPPANSDHAATDGNCFFRTGQFRTAPLLKVRNHASGGTPSFPTLDDYRGPPESPHFTESKHSYTPGFEHSSLEADPLFQRFGPAQLVPAWQDDLRLRADSPAGHTGVELQGPLAVMDNGVTPHRADPTVGFLPLGADPLAVGVDGRRRFPAPVPGLPGASHGDPSDTLAHG